MQYSLKVSSSDISRQRQAVSLLIGVALTLTIPIVAALVFFDRSKDAVVASLLFGPLILIEKLGFSLDCVNANSVSEKLTCVRMSLLIDLVWYPLIIAILSSGVYVALFRRRRKRDV